MTRDERLRTELDRVVLHALGRAREQVVELAESWRAAEEAVRIAAGAILAISPFDMPVDDARVIEWRARQIEAEDLWQRYLSSIKRRDELLREHRERGGGG